jgi:phosphate:Na+ symporter
VTPLAAEEAVRRTVARSLGAICGSIAAMLTPRNHGTSVSAGKDAVSVTNASDALRQAREFMSEASGPPESEEEQERLTHTLHAFDHASRLAELAAETGYFGSLAGRSEDEGAAGLCAEAMRHAVLIADEVGALPDTLHHATPVGALDGEKEVVVHGAPIEQALTQLEQCANRLRELQRAHRKETLSAVASGTLSADEAMTRVDAVRRLDALAHHAWRSAAHLVGSRT